MFPLIKYLQLRGKERRAFHKAFYDVMILRKELKKKSFPEFKEWFKTELDSRKKDEDFSLDQLVLANKRACKYFAPAGRPCLYQALSGHMQCKLQGIKTSVVIGVRKDHEEFKAHAWLLKKDEILLGNLPDLNEYHEIVRFENL